LIESYRRNQGFFCLGCPKLFPLKPKGHHSKRGEDLRAFYWQSSERITHPVLEARNYGAAFDGSFGIDSEDILNIPQIAFSSSQLFPDQFKYGKPNPSLPPFNQTVQVGVDWIKRQAALANV